VKLWVTTPLLLAANNVPFAIQCINKMPCYRREVRDADDAFYRFLVFFQHFLSQDNQQSRWKNSNFDLL